MSNIEEDIMSEEAFNELIDNFEIVNTLTEYGRKAIKQNVKNLQKRIKELEEENRIFKDSNVLVNRYFKLKDDSIPKQKVKNKIEVLRMEEKYDYLDNKRTIQILEELLEEK